MPERGRFITQEIPERDLAVLRVSGEMEFEQRKDFVEAFDGLLESDCDKIVVDLTRIQRLFSIYLGTLVDFQQRSDKAGKTFSILAGQRLHTLFEKAKLLEVLTIVVVDDE